MGAAIHAGRSRFRFLGRTERVRPVHQVPRHRSRWYRVQDLVMAKLRNRRDRGFTLIELMIVISMILILVSISIPAYNQSILRAKESVLRQDLFELRSLISQ